MMKLAYRFDPDYVSTGRHYAHSLISWTSVFAGVAVAVAVGLTLSLIGAAIGAAAFNPFRFEAQEDPISVGAALYLMFSQFVALQLGGYVAARSARYPDHFGGALTGVVVWAVSVAFAIVMASLAATGGDAAVASALGAAQDVRAGADATDLSAVEAAADTAATLTSIAAAALLLGAAGAIAGGWLGAHHPKWDDRPRIADVPS
jgi:hypothetical protein